MAISIFHLAQTETEQMMTAMLNVLEHADGLVKAGSITEDALMSSSLAPDMLSLSHQVWRGSDNARAAARLAGREVPHVHDKMGELSINEARTLVNDSLALLRSISEDELEGGGRQNSGDNCQRKANALQRSRLPTSICHPSNGVPRDDSLLPGSEGWCRSWKETLLM